MSEIKQLRCKEDIKRFANLFGLTEDWHEPDEQCITATVEGRTFDNAYGTYKDKSGKYLEKVVILKVDNKPVAAINLADLFEIACR